jgi:two-component system, OmpR family, alkaline phosphatase synthesis response regulator PhoP
MRTKTPTMSVLVADPDIVSQQQLIACLGAQYQVRTAVSLQGAWGIIAQARPRTLIIEVNQPDGDGVQLIERLRSDPATRGMILICVTTRRTIWDKVRGFQAGADDYIIKPINPDTFATRLALLEQLRQLTS